jgi:hypothetical protein
MLLRKVPIVVFYLTYGNWDNGYGIKCNYVRDTAKRQVSSDVSDRYGSYAVEPGCG